jgi:hypothetical protein
MQKLRFLCCLATLLLFIAGCQNAGSPVTIVVPRNFRGEIRIIESADSPEMPFQQGEYRCVIPASGRLAVKSLLPFERFHTETVVLDDGTVPSIYSHPVHSTNETEIAVFDGGLETTYTDPPTTARKYFIGLKKDASNWRF